MGKYRAKKVIYNDDSYEYIIQKRIFGLFWINLQIRNCVNNVYFNEIVICNEDYVTDFITDNDKFALESLKWFYYNKKKYMFKEKWKHFIWIS